MLPSLGYSIWNPWNGSWIPWNFQIIPWTFQMDSISLDASHNNLNQIIVKKLLKIFNFFYSNKVWKIAKLL